MSIRDDFTIRNVIVLGLLGLLLLIFFALSASSITEDVSTDILERYGTDYGAILVMDFEEGQGVTAYDQGPFGNDGVITGASWTSGKYGEALYFSGVDLINVSDSTSLDIPKNITLEAWARDPPLEINLDGFDIVGNSVVVNDSRAYLSVEPHTIGSSGWVEFTLTSKKFSGDIDVVWGFNRTLSRPKNPQIWVNYTHTLSRWVEVEKTYVNETSGEVVNYTSRDKEYYESSFFDWKNVNLDFNKVEKDAKGMDTWYVLKEVSIVAGKEYKLRCWVEIPFDGKNLVSGKYAWGIKLSSDTIREAIDSDRFYFIDPWYNDLWLYRTEITIDSGDVDEVLTNFAVMVHLNSSRIDWLHVQDDLDDIRFTLDDEVTLLSYEIENIVVNTDAWLWVKIPTISNVVDTVFYMYYGNAIASSIEDKEAVWDDNFVMVQHMVDNDTSSILDSTQYDNDGTKVGANEPLEVSGMINSAQKFDGVNDIVYVFSSPTTQFSGNTISLCTWVKTTDSGPLFFRLTNNGLQLYIDAGKLKWYIRNSTGADTVLQGTTNVVDDTWHYAVGVFNTTHVLVYLDGGSDATPISRTDDIGLLLGRNLELGALTYWWAADFWNGTLDEMRISNATLSPSWIRASYESERDDFLTYGTEITVYKVIVGKNLAYGLYIEEYTGFLRGQINETKVLYLVDTLTDWHYYAMTYDGAYIRLYIDGVLVNSTALTEDIPLNNNPVYIGTRFIGEIDQVRVYNVTKTAGEIQNQYLNTGHMYSRSVTISDNFRVLNSTLDEQISLDEFGLDMNLNYILYMPLETWVHHDTIGGATREHVMDVPLGSTFQDKYYFKLIVTVDQPPGIGKTVNTTLTDGTNSMTVLITGEVDISGSTTDNVFTLDVSAENLALEQSQTAGGLSVQSSVLLLWYYVETD